MKASHALPTRSLDNTKTSKMLENDEKSTSEENQGSACIQHSRLDLLSPNILGWGDGSGFKPQGFFESGNGFRRSET